MQNGRDHKFEFQGQEIQDELGLDWISFKWRNHDPAIGRFMNIDPLAEDYVYNGVYNFSENRVIDGVELDGLEHLSVTSYDVRKTDVGYVAEQTGQQTYRNTGDWSGTKNIDSYSVYDQNGKVVRTSTGSIDLKNNGINISSIKNREVSFGQVADWYANSDDRAAKGFRQNMKNTALAALSIPFTGIGLLEGGGGALTYIGLATELDSFAMDADGNTLSDSIENVDIKMGVDVAKMTFGVGAKAKAFLNILKNGGSIQSIYEAISSYAEIIDSGSSIKEAKEKEKEEDEK